MSRRFKTTVYLDSLQYRRLKEIGEEQGATAAEQIREAIDEYLKGHGDRPEPRSLASGSSGRHDLSENAEEHEIASRHPSLRLGLVDAVVIAVAERLEAEAIATLDLRDFGAVDIKGSPRLLPRDL